jgi:hypothetical protein
MPFAIFVREGDETYDQVNEVPEQLRKRTLAVRLSTIIPFLSNDRAEMSATGIQCLQRIQSAMRDWDYSSRRSEPRPPT